MISLAFQRGLIDTSIAQEIRTSEPAAVAFALAYMKRHRFEMSELTAMSLIAASPDTLTLRNVLTFVNACKLLPIHAKISRRAVRILGSLTPPSPLTPDDAIVAATAMFHKLALYTLDPPRFGIVAGLNAIRPY